MKGTLTTAALVIVATLVAAVSAHAEILPGANPTRAEYVAAVDPICQKNTDSNKPILKSARLNVKADKLPQAGKNFTSVLGKQIFPEGLENADRGMAAVLQIGRMSVPEVVDVAWNAWYNGEYIPGYRTVPGVTYARRYRVLDGEVRYTTVYEFENEAVPESAAWDHQREHSSPRSGAMRDAMTMAMGSPGVYRRI